MSAYEQLEAAAEQLKQSERGQRVLKNLSRLASEGALSLDSQNKKAATELFAAMLHNPWDLPAWFTAAEEKEAA